MQLTPTSIRFQVDDNNNGRLLMNSNASSSSDHYFNRHYFQIRSADIIYDVARSSSSQYGRKRRSKVETRTLPLLIREHKKEDVVRCLDSLSVKRNQRPITIAFVGDSTARQHYLSLIRVSIQLYYSPFHFTHSVEYCINYYRRFLITTGSLSKSLQHKNSRETLSRRLEFDQSSVD